MKNQAIRLIVRKTVNVHTNNCSRNNGDIDYADSYEEAECEIKRL